MHEAPLPVDAALHSWMVVHRADGLTAPAVAITTTGSGLPAYSLAAVAGVTAVGWRRWWRRALAAVAALAVGNLLRFALAAGIGRSRPPAADWAWHAAGPALPSGHTTTSALVAGLLWVAVAKRPGLARTVVRAAAVAWTAAVGLTRVYLGVHWPTDVAAGWLLAATLVLAAQALTPGRWQGQAVSGGPTRRGPTRVRSAHSRREGAGGGEASAVGPQPGSGWEREAFRTASRTGRATSCAATEKSTSAGSETP